MARKSLVLNGFLGGINEDGDLSDLESEDSQGRNQLAVCNDALCNQPGKIRAKRPDVVTGSGSITVQGTQGSTDDFLIHGSKWYRHKGVYKLGEEIEYSRDAGTTGSTTINRPIAAAAGRIAANSSQLANSIGLDTDGTSSGDDLSRVFWGKTASTNSTGAALYANGTLHPSAGTVPSPNTMMRFAIDGDNDERFENSDYVDYHAMGIFHSDSDWTVGLWDDDGSESTTSGSYGWSNIGSGALVDLQWHASGDRDLSAADFIRFGRNASSESENRDVGIIFRVGDTSFSSGSRPVGMFGADFNITDKDIYIEIDFNSCTGGDFNVGEFWNGFEGINITADSQGSDSTIHYSDNDFDSYAKTWEISKSELVNYGCESAQKSTEDDYVTGADGGGRFKIPWSSAIHTGSNFSSANIKQIAVVLVGGDMEAPGHADPLTVWVARLYELSFQSAGSIGWANTVTQFSQSRIYESTAGNKVESLLQHYSNYLDLTSDNTLNIKFYQPTTANYEGKVYYQDCDDTGTPLGSAFLIADVSYDKGVKSILSDFYEKWVSNAVSVNFSDPPVGSTHQLESGYAQNTETVNAIWKHAAVVGRQVYIGNVIKTGDDLPVTDSKSGGSSASQENFPKIDSTNLTAILGATYKYKIVAGGETFTVTKDSGSPSSAVDIGANAAYVDTTVDGIHISFPTDTGYATDDEWEFVTTTDQDLILKSAIGKRYGFPDTQYVDLELPGTGITAMYAVGDRLFAFSSSTLTIVNVAQDYEYLEGTFMGKGIATPKQVVEVEEGIAFVNSTGVYYFDGSRMESLSDDLMMTFDWSIATSIGYLPDEKLVCVWHTASTGILTYSLATKAWVGNSLSNVTPTTRIKFYANEPHWIESTTLKKLSIVDSTADSIVIQTGKISCGDLSRYKKFIKALVTINNGAEFELYYKIDSGAYNPVNNLSDGTTDISIGEKGKTIQFSIESGGAVDVSTEISDITLVYRDLRID